MTSTAKPKPLTCPACGHADPRVPASDGPSGVFRCTECCNVTAYGVLLPRVVVEQHHDEHGRPWVRRRFQDPKTKADLYVVDLPPALAATEMKAVLSLVIP